MRFSPYLFISPFFLLFAVVGLFPLVYTAYVSLFDWSLIGGKGEFVGLDNFRDVLGNPYFLKSLVNTISIFVLSSGPQIVIAVCLAGLLDSHLRGRTLWRMSILLPFVVSPAAVAIIFGSLFGDRYGLINDAITWIGLEPIQWHVDRFASHIAIASMVNWRWTGFNALIFLAAMQAVPRDVYESAALDGAGRIRQFISITIPMIRPTMIFVIITSTIGGLQIFAEPRMFDETIAHNGGSDRQFSTLTMLIYDFGWHLRDLGRASATAWLLFLVIVVFALINLAVSRRVGALRGMRNDQAPGFLVYGLLTAFVLGSAAPLYWSFLIGSHTKEVMARQTPPLLPGGHFFENAQRVFETVAFWKALGNSLLISGVAATSVVFFGTLAGFAFAKLRFRGNIVLLGFIIATMAVPTQLGVVPLFILMAKLGWTGSVWAVIIPWIVTAFGVFFMRQYLVDAIPDELVEAARVDGCSMFRIFRHVAVPAARPAAAMLWLFTFMYVWTDFFWPLIVLPGDNPTVQIALNQLQSGYYKDYALVLAGATLATIPLLVLFIATGKQFVTGIMQGAVKG